MNDIWGLFVIFGKNVKNHGNTNFEQRIEKRRQAFDGYCQKVGHGPKNSRTKGFDIGRSEIAESICGFEQYFTY